jgi:hypothetical protein
VLSATIRDITAVIGDPACDMYAGDIRNATVTFVNRGNNTPIATVPVGLVNPSDTKTGTATYVWNVNIGNADSESYTIGFIVNNWYTRNSSADDEVVTVKKPTAGSIGGGGFLINSSSEGTYAGDAGHKTNFGLNVKYNKSGKNLQGNVNIIVRRTETDGLHVYQIKSNSIDSLSITSIAGGYKATFTSKANLTDVTDPNNPIPLGGNKALQITMTDKGEPGSSDTIGVMLTDPSGGLLFSSNWNGVNTVEQLLGGGNLQVRPAQLLDGASGSSAPAGSTITSADVQQLLPAAAARWQAAGVDATQLRSLENLQIQIDDFASGELAWAMPGVITIDSDASGYGWFVDSTPFDDSEFASGLGNRAVGQRVDLLTVLTHELGHLLGQNTIFGDSNDVMGVSLGTGVRRLPDASVHDSSVQSEGADPNQTTLRSGHDKGSRRVRTVANVEATDLVFATVGEDTLWQSSPYPSRNGRNTADRSTSSSVVNQTRDELPQGFSSPHGRVKRAMKLRG